MSVVNDQTRLFDINEKMATGIGTSSQCMKLMPSECHPLAQIICIIVVLNVLKQDGGLQPKKNRTLPQISNLGLVFTFFGFFSVFSVFKFWPILNGLTGCC